MNETDNQQKRLMDIGWLAGIIEGEGCFCLQKTNGAGSKTFSPLFQITNTNPLIILKAAKIMKELNLPCWVYLQKQGDYRLCYRVVAFGIKRVKKVIDFLAPYIECRKDQLEAMRTFVDSRLSRPERSLLNEVEQKAIETLQQLNRPYLFSTTARLPQELVPFIKGKKAQVMIQSDLHGDMKAAPAA